MFITKKHLSRRTMLRGAGVNLALLFLSAMVPAATALAQTAAAPKIRAGFFYIPHGAIMHNTSHGPSMDRWTPSGAGVDFASHARGLGALASEVKDAAQLAEALQVARRAPRTTVIVIETDPTRSTSAGGHWWDVPVPEVSARAEVAAARERYQRARRPADEG